jgi:hypothetical protein
MMSERDSLMLKMLDQILIFIKMKDASKMIITIKIPEEKVLNNIMTKIEEIKSILKIILKAKGIHLKNITKI